MPRFKTQGEESHRRLAARLFAVGALFAVCYGILMSRAIFFHLKDNTDISKVALRQYRTAVKLSTERGRILDSTGKELAINLPRESVYADPRFIKDPEKTAEILGGILDLDQKKISKMISSNRKFVWIKRRLSTEEARGVDQAKLDGIFLMSENGRSYPNGELASAVIGTVSVDAEGLSGVEYQYNDLLLANNKDSNYSRDARGHLYLSPADEKEEEYTAHVQLTIDKVIQHITERELKGMMLKSRSKNGVAIVLDSRNGDILAMASAPFFDPNRFDQYTPGILKNRAVADIYEPGSTFKAITIAAALDENIVDDKEIFDCGNGKLKVGKMFVNDAHPHKRLSVADIIKVSSNIGAARIQTKLGRNDIYEKIKAFGFGELSGVDLPGESKGILSSPEEWSEIQFVTIAFGQGIGTTPLQMAVAFAAIANGGELLKPHLIKRVVNENGETIYERKKEVRGRPIKTQTADLMRKLLKRVVEEGGTGLLASSSEYQMAGKTGTAQKASPRGGYLEGKYYASFIGFAPANDPRIVVYVGLDEPQGYYYGGQVAAPVFKNAAEEILHYMNVPAQTHIVQSDGEPDLSALAEGPTMVSRQNIEQVTQADVEQGELNAVTEENPENVPEIVTRSQNVRVTSMPDNKWKLPDFKGLTMKGVLEAAGDAKINLKFMGSGIAIGQNPAAGTVVPDGAECKVVFKKML